ncbi:hypothetical protein FRC01_002691, partial [Tulasnella sp. 417]
MLRRHSLLAAVPLLSLAVAQKVGTLVTDPTVALTWINYASTTSYLTRNAKITLDAEWRSTHLHPIGPACFANGVWDGVNCPATNPPLCAQRCAIEGADYYSTYGIRTSGNYLELGYVTQWSTFNAASRVFMLSWQDNTKYEIWKPLNKEFTFDIDVSALPCGVKATVSFLEMDADGGKAKYPSNLAGARYGTGYCDSKCPHIKWINGEANVKDWNWGADPNGFGHYGSCCGEVDIFEGNSMAASFSAHPCSLTSPTRCENDSCGPPDGNPSLFYCDPDGCDWNSYRLGNVTYYGPGSVLNTYQKLTVLTRFITDDGTDTGNLVEIQRFYIQNGKVFSNSLAMSPGLAPTSSSEHKSITNEFCNAQKNVFGDMNHFQARGGLQAVGESLKRGVVLSFSILDDWDRHLQWLDGTWPADWPPSMPGITRGGCPANSGDPENLRVEVPNSRVIISNI